ncbi:peroxiredoxin family protein [Rhodohalobacter sp. 8-1]|uniref:peroxiredoxin family protein n=1 Tax=Rhodohalobacter sp. 8-1 TaxID=3131972 RepID=UPI0030ECC6C6
MIIGNTTDDIVVGDKTFVFGLDPNHAPEKLSDITSDFTVVVFGASWCPKCREEIPEIAGHYPKWKKQGVEVVFVSLDEDEESFSRFVKDFPFISTSDYKKWDSPIVNDYYVFATPTMYLLDSNREILLRPKSVRQMDAWIDWYLVEGN